MRNAFALLAAGGIMLSACGAPAPVAPAAAATSTPAPTTTTARTATPIQIAEAAATLTPAVALPMVENGLRRVLFINGDHLPDTGYPHSRVGDDGSKPESFSQLRAQVLEGELGLTIDEFVLGAANSISPGLLSPYRAVVLGSNGRLLTAGEAATLNAYVETGGRILIYADFQYGPDNWASDNVFLKPLGIEVFPDNFQPTTVITDIVRPGHPVMNGVSGFATEGSSQFLISAAALSRVTVLSRCSPLPRSGCAVQAPEQAKIRPGDEVVCTWVLETGNGGRIAGTCDRNTFHNGPGIGTSLGEYDNRRYAVNLFRWLSE
jgi:hypothetical protein